LLQKEIESVIIKFAGDSGDGMQVSGSLFTSTTAIYGNDLSTFPDFPAEIRAPAGTVAGVSGFQIRFGSSLVHTPGDECDVLVAMNAAALKSNLSSVAPQGIIIANSSGFDSKNLRLAGYQADDLPLEQAEKMGFKVLNLDLSKVSKETLLGEKISTKELERGKNMVALGLVCWMFNRNLDQVLELTKQRFAKNPAWAEWNQRLVKAGWNFGETIELFHERYQVNAASLPSGKYRGVSGNEALALGLVAASHKAGLQLFLGAYPITPASDILHELAKLKHLGANTFMAEDEIAAITSAIGVSYGGNLGVTASSGPGIALKTEAIGLAVMLELPLVICNIQRGGPSTGMPTKTEQADLFQAIFGRNGECELIVVAPGTPKECFDIAFQAVKLSVEHMTPVMLLSDGYIANGAEPWKFPSMKNLAQITPPIAEAIPYKPYLRDGNLVRQWAFPGMKDMQHRIGGIEKEDITGNISYDPLNHHKMVYLRKEKVAKVAKSIPPQLILQGPQKGKILVIGWGSTKGAITSAVETAHKAGIEVSQIHIQYLHPFPENLGDILSSFEYILIPELNTGQLAFILKANFQIHPICFNKVQGKPFFAKEIFDKLIEINQNA